MESDYTIDFGELERDRIAAGIKLRREVNKMYHAPLVFYPTWQELAVKRRERMARRKLRARSRH